MRKTITLFVLLFNCLSYSQPGTLDMSFNPGSGANYVLSSSIQSDGKIIVGGMFSTYDGIARNNLARVNKDGSLDQSFNSEKGNGTDWAVSSIVALADGKILIGGQFTEYNGVSQNHIARLNSDGSLDTSFNSGTLANGYVSAICVQSDGKILIGGYFTSFNGFERNYIARLNSDGSLDMGFNPGAGANGEVNSIAVQSDGKILIGGTFTSYGGVARNYVARLSSVGSLDTSFDPGCGADNYIYSVIVQSDSKILIGGKFRTFNNVIQNRIARLNSDGSLDIGFNSGTGLGPDDSYVTSMSIQSDNNILIGGYFTSCNGVNVNNLTRLKTDGSLDTYFYQATGLNYTVETISAQTDDKFIIGGFFYTYAGVSRMGIARINEFTPSPSGSSQTFCLGAKVANLVASGYGLKWYSSNTSQMVLASNAILNTGKYYVSQTLNGSESKRTIVSVIINQPVTPEFSQVSAVCSGAELSPLLTISNNNISGIWSPAINNISTTTYTFTPEIGACATASEMTIYVNEKPETPMISLNNSILYSNSNEGNQWYNQNGVISGAVDQEFSPSQSGSYYVVLTKNGCSSKKSNSIDYSVLGISENKFEKSIQLYPNPVSDILTIDSQENISPEVEIYDTLGKCVKTTTSFDNRIDVSSLSSGIYILKVIDSSNEVYKSKFVKK